MRFFFLVSAIGLPATLLSLGCDTSELICSCYGPSVSISAPEGAQLSVVGGGCTAYTESCERIPDGGEPRATCGRTTILIQSSASTGTCDIRLTKADDTVVESTLSYSVRQTDCCPESTITFENDGEALQKAGAVIH